MILVKTVFNRTIPDCRSPNRATFADQQVSCLQCQTLCFGVREVHLIKFRQVESSPINIFRSEKRTLISARTFRFGNLFSLLNGKDRVESTDNPTTRKSADLSRNISHVMQRLNRARVFQPVIQRTGKSVLLFFFALSRLRVSFVLFHISHAKFPVSSFKSPNSPHPMICLSIFLSALSVSFASASSSSSSSTISSRGRYSSPAPVWM